VNSRVSHLQDDRLYDHYLSGRSGDALDPSTAVHLTDCSTCRARYSELSDFFDAMRAEGEAEANELFTAEHLRHQHDQVMKQIEHVNRSAKVISFPGRVTRHIAGPNVGVAPRWLAAAAAAGLFVGVAVGGAFSTPQWRSSGSTSRATTAPPARAAQPAAQPAVIVNTPAPAPAADDDAFLTELEFALQRPHTRELQPFDVLTPHAREIRSRVR